MADCYDRDSLLENRAGRLTDKQARQLTNASLRLFLVGFGLLAVFIVGQASTGEWAIAGARVPPLVVGTVALVALVALTPWLWRSYLRTREAQAGRVVAIEGVAEVRTKQVGETSAEYLYVGGENLRPSSGLRKMIRGTVRVYVLPKTRVPVNVEQLAPATSDLDQVLERLRR